MSVGPETGSPAAHRSGFVALVGRPNTGKSTLLNAMVGESIAITSSKPQTTRYAIRGVVTREHAQIVLVDTPGLHRPRTLLGERLNALVDETLSGVDVVAVCLPADERHGPGDRRIVDSIAHGRARRVAIVTKVDTVGPERVVDALAGVARLGEEVDAAWDEIVPVSSVDGFQIELLVGLLAGLLPVGPQLYPADQKTDTATEQRISDLIRAEALEGMRDELPHSLTVVIDEMSRRAGRSADRPLTDVHATMLLERDSQKAIVIGHRGERLRAIGSAARPGIEALLGTAVYLHLHVAVEKDWQRDPKALRKLGF